MSLGFRRESIEGDYSCGWKWGEAFSFMEEELVQAISQNRLRKYVFPGNGRKGFEAGKEARRCGYRFQQGALFSY